MTSGPKLPRLVINGLTVIGCGDGEKGGGVRLRGVDADITDAHFENNRIDIDAADAAVRVSKAKFVGQLQKPSRTTKD